MLVNRAAPGRRAGRRAARAVSGHIPPDIGTVCRWYLTQEICCMPNMVSDNQASLPGDSDHELSSSGYMNYW